MKQKLYDILHSGPVSKFIYWLIIVNVLSIILESYADFKAAYGWYLYVFEVFSVVIFTIEYVIRLYTAPLEFKVNSKIKSRWKFASSGYGIIDLIAILPFYLPFLFAVDLRILRVLRLIRLLRIFKLGRHSKALRSILDVLKETRSELSISFFVAFILLLLSSTLMYYIEHEVQPESFASIGHSFWWAIATLTTVGYGDVYPVTAAGKILGGITAIIGIGFLALPTGIISSAFIEKVKETKENKSCACPNCGHEIKENN
ncbi:ion transporter [Nonlabens marinus]|uniref:Potassium voltage-gated channel subfamily KQT n=1 Tax=Nonlabens marinus S1-08 TaxID=1454201 RepID=W8VNQ4_9FLAO|nr:ion transporter [Nonlabens marinus]BAO54594.1 potassium voltage-gated channel subfamily KQT [Nonlabens marinus S1-08]